MAVNPAQLFYEKLGFIVTEKTRNFSVWKQFQLKGCLFWLVPTRIKISTTFSEQCSNAAMTNQTLAFAPAI